jgi:hypothetical protein
MNERIQRALNERIEAFAHDVTAILTDAVAAAVADAFGSGKGRAGTSTVTAKRGKQRDKAGRRTRAQVQLEADVLLREVTRKGGQRMEQIAKKLRLSTKALALPMHALLKAKKVKKTGVARGTTYRAAA